LLKYLNDPETFVQFEGFLKKNKNYDVDYLHFYIKVLEFRKESRPDKAKLAAGTIIDEYLAEDAAHYISFESAYVSELIAEYERCCIKREEVPKYLFERVTKNVRALFNFH